jgi:hypothetical protein
VQAQTTYTATFDHHTVRITGAGDCSGKTVSTDYSTASASFTASATCEDATLNAQFSVTYPVDAPTATSKGSSWQFASALNRSLAISGTWKTPDATYAGRVTAGSAGYTGENCSTVNTSTDLPAGTSSFSAKVPCAQTEVTARIIDGQLWLDIYYGADLKVGPHGSIFGASLTAEVHSYYRVQINAAPEADKNQAPPPPISDAAPAAKDTMFVATSDPGLNTGCTFRSAGPLNITVPITRYVGQTTDEGFLANPSMLIENNVISRTAKLRLLVFDVDSDNSGAPGQRPELDLVTVNGQNIGPPETQGEAYLKGQNGKWVLNTFEFPIHYLKFPKRADAFSTPLEAQNVVSIDMDTLNTSDVWCASVGWAAISIGAMAPLVLVHGTNAQHDTWEISIDGMTSVEFLQSRGIVFDHMVDLVPNGTPEGNAILLWGYVDNRLASMGAQNVHLITHSKGATDSRSMLHNRYTPGQPFTVLTLFSLGTPSRGTILSDYGVEYEKLHLYLSLTDKEVISEGMIQAAMGHALARFGLAPSDPARKLQTHAAMTEFNAATPPRPDVHYFSLAGNADTDGDGVISAAEASPLFPAAGVTDYTDEILSSLATRTYQVLGRTQAVWVTPNLIRPVKGFVAPDVQPNDLTSVANSVHCDICGFQPLPATSGWGAFPTAAEKAIYPYNHSGLRSPRILDLILQKIQELYPVAPE